MPFYIRNFQTLEKLTGNEGMEAQIRNVWPGIKRECCTTADNLCPAWDSNPGRSFAPALCSKRTCSCLSERPAFETLRWKSFVVFPQGSSSATKGALLGSTVLLDFTVFEPKDGGCLVVTW